MSFTRSFRPHRATTLVLAAAFGVATFTAAADDPPCFIARDLGVVAALDGTRSDQLGKAVAASGDTLVAGVWLDDDARGLNTGSVYVWRRVGDAWTFEQMITSPQAAPDERFGDAVAIDGDTLAVGARLSDNGVDHAGAVYVFTREGGAWTFQARLEANDRARGDHFGAAVALRSGTLVAGAPRADVAGQMDSGAAYVFVREHGVWSQRAKLTADGRFADHVGDCVAVGAAGEVFVGAPQRDVRPAGSPITLLDAGAAYVFSPDSGGQWVQRQVLTANDLTLGARFGSAIAVDGTVLAIGAEADLVSGIRAGSAYVFVASQSGWVQQQKLTAPEPRAVNDYFGASIAAADGAIAVAAREADLPGIEDVGRGFVFTPSEGVWTLRNTFAATTPTVDLYMGASVAIAGGAAFFSSPYFDVNDQTDAGGVFAFQYLGAAPGITEQPQSARTCGGGAEASFAASIRGDEPLSLRWRRDGVPLTDGPTEGGSIISGSGTSTLTITAAGRADRGSYDLVVSNACGEAPTAPADLRVCTADWNCDGAANSTDVGAFINDWFVDLAKGTLTTDIDVNGVVNSADVSEFINFWFEDVGLGC